MAVLVAGALLAMLMSAGYARMQAPPTDSGSTRWETPSTGTSASMFGLQSLGLPRVTD